MGNHSCCPKADSLGNMSHCILVSYNFISHPFQIAALQARNIFFNMLFVQAPSCYVLCSILLFYHSKGSRWKTADETFMHKSTSFKGVTVQMHHNITLRKRGEQGRDGEERKILVGTTKTITFHWKIIGVPSPNSESFTLSSSSTQFSLYLIDAFKRALSGVHHFPRLHFILLTTL